MAKILFSDKAATTMSGSLASGLGTLNVAPGGGARFPSPTGGDFFYATLYQKDGGGAEINIEVVKITAKPSADSFTISQRDVTNITGYGGGYAYPGAAGTVYVELRWLERAATAMMQAADMTAGNVSFTPAGNVVASNLQAAVQELDTEKAPLASPALTGTPTAPTAGAGTSTTQIATTAFVSSAIGVHNSVASAHGVSGSVVGTTDTQTLTNKTLGSGSIWNGGTVGVQYGGTGATTLTGLVKGNGTSAFTAAVAGTDYSVPANTVPRDSATGAASIPTGTTAQRPGSPTQGMLRRNSQLGQWEGYDGANWTGIGGASGGGGNPFCYENDITVTADYTITTNKNAMSAGPITINNGVTVTVPNGSVWSIV